MTPLALIHTHTHYPTTTSPSPAAGASRVCQRRRTPKVGAGPYHGQHHGQAEHRADAGERREGVRCFMRRVLGSCARSQSQQQSGAWRRRRGKLQASKQAPPLPQLHISVHLLLIYSLRNIKQSFQPTVISKRSAEPPTVPEGATTFYAARIAAGEAPLGPRAGSRCALSACVCSHWHCHSPCGALQRILVKPKHLQTCPALLAARPPPSR